jgi:hypothetical protein
MVYIGAGFDYFSKWKRADLFAAPSSTMSLSSMGKEVKGPHTSCIIIYTSKVSSVERRTWVRRQFQRNMALLRAQDTNLAAGVVMKFVLGTADLHPDEVEKITAEALQYEDILQLDLPDFDDPDPSPPGVDSATSLKVVQSMVWAVRNYTFDYFIRIGDDSYLRIDYFLTEAALTLPKERMLLGYCKGIHYAFTSPNGNIAKTDVPYCSGMGFVLTYDAVSFAARNAELLVLDWPEDATVARWFAGTKISILHDRRFVDWASRACDNETIIVHKHKYEYIPENGIMSSCFSTQ